MLVAAILAPLLGAFLTFNRGATMPFAAPAFLTPWLFDNTDEIPTRTHLQRGWCVFLIGAWPAVVVWSILAGEMLKHRLVWVNGHSLFFYSLDVVWHWDGAFTFAAIAWAGASAALTLGHARFQDFGTYVPPGQTEPEDTYEHDFIGMAWTGAAEALAAAMIVAFFGFWIEAAIMLLGGALKAVSYSIGWSRLPQRLFGQYWEPTRAAEVLQGFFLYGSFSLALLVGELA